MFVDVNITKDNIDRILNEFAKQYKKCCGLTPAEIVIVGGGSVVINYGFRQMTQDLDVILRTASGVKDAIYQTSEKMGLPNDWMNTDFKFLCSYSPKLEEISKHYRTLNNGTLEIRTVNAEYLIAMKMQSGREFGNDIADIIGIIRCEKEKGTDISFEKINNAGLYLYGENFNVSNSLIDRVKKYCTLSIEQLEKEYEKSIILAKNIRIEMSEQNGNGVMNKESAKNLAQIIESHMSNDNFERD